MPKGTKTTKKQPRLKANRSQSKAKQKIRHKRWSDMQAQSYRRYKRRNPMTKGKYFETGV